MAIRWRDVRQPGPATFSNLEMQYSPKILCNFLQKLLAKNTDILYQHANTLLKEWSNSFESNATSSIFNVFGSLFSHYQEHKDFYDVLYRNGLTDPILNSIKSKIGLDADLNNRDAYSKAFFAYGMYGWITEWMKRGMQENPEEINTLLSDAAKNYRDITLAMFPLGQGKDR